MSNTVIIGGTSGIGRQMAAHFAARGDDVVITGRDASRAAAAAKEIEATASGDKENSDKENSAGNGGITNGGAAENGGEIGGVRGIGVELTDPHAIAAALASVDHVDHVVLAAIDRDQNTAADYQLDGALRLATLKLVGYTEVVHALLPRMSRDGAIVVFGGLAKDRPYPGSTTVSTVNGAVMGLVHTLAVELAPIRVNAIHPGIVGDSPFWTGKPLDHVLSRTPSGRLATMADVVDAVAFLLRNRSVNGVHLNVDGGWLLA